MRAKIDKSVGFAAKANDKRWLRLTAYINGEAHSATAIYQLVGGTNDSCRVVNHAAATSLMPQLKS